MTLTIRPAAPDDAAALGRLGAMLMRTHYDFDRRRFLAPREGAETGYAAFLRSRIDADDESVLVAEEKGVIVGYVYAALEPLSWKELRGPAGFIHDIAVEERARRAHVARRLLSAALQWLRERGAPRVVLWTATQNAPAHALFRSLGFRDTMTEMTLDFSG